MGSLRLAVMVLGLLAMTQQSMQMRSPDLHHENKFLSSGSKIGILFTSDTNVKALTESNAFISSSSFSVAGRKFQIGSINGVDVVYVMAGSGSINTALSAQLLFDHFEIEGLVHCGTAGTVNDSVSVADVLLLKEVADVGTWTWQKYSGSSETLSKGGYLKFGDYNVPDAGENYLEKITYEPVKIYSPPNKTRTSFWLPANTTWLTLADQLLGLTLENCISSSKCMDTTPQVTSGLRGVSADIYVKNAAYRSWLSTKFKASAVDEESAAAALAAASNDKPIVFIRGISNTAGGSSKLSKYGYLGSVNAAKVLTEFVKLAGSANKASY